MRKQPDITHAMRSILVDWMVEVIDEFHLDPQTLFLAVSYADRYLSRMSVMRSKLQLLGTACMYVSAKFEEIYPPDIGEFSYITDDTYNKKQVRYTLQYPITCTCISLFSLHRLSLWSSRYSKCSTITWPPPPYTHSCSVFSRSPAVSMVYRRNSSTSKWLLSQWYDTLVSIAHHILCLLGFQFLCELAAQDGDPFLKYLPSVMAASAVCLARHTLTLEPWVRVTPLLPSLTPLQTLLLQHYSGYSVSELSQCLQDLHRTHALAHCHAQQAIRTKYSSDK